MKLELKRLKFEVEYTEGKLYIDGKYFCDTLEDKVRNLPSEAKIYGQTAIPPGFYNVELSMSNRFKRILPAILNVPYFQGIRIHRGNTASDSHGCILVGKRSAPGVISQSSINEQNLVKTLSDNNKITIEVL